MSKVKIQGNASGSGVFTLTSPNSATDRTITLPDASGTLAFTTDDDDKLPLAGGTMTGDLVLGDNVRLEVGSLADGDMVIYHDGSNSYIDERGTGQLNIRSSRVDIKKYTGETMAQFVADDGCALFFNNAARISTTAIGVTVAGTIIATTDTDTSNTGNVTLDFAANQNFVLTLTGNTTLVNPTTEQVGQSGFIAFIQDGTGSRTITLGTDYETAGAAGITLTAAASKTDLVPYVVVAAGRILLGQPQRNFS